MNLQAPDDPRSTPSGELTVNSGGEWRPRKMSKKADAVGTDLAAPEAASELAAKVRDLVGDKLDIVVANAGISKAGAHGRSHHG